MEKLQVTSRKSQVRLKIKGLFRFMILSFTFLLPALLCGCATLADAPKGFLGISTRALEEGRKEAVIGKFNLDYDRCYKETKEALKEIQAYIYAADNKKEMLAVYLSGSDTTPVGLFFSRLDSANTQIEVASPSVYAKELIAAKVFKALEWVINPALKEAALQQSKQKE